MWTQTFARYAPLSPLPAGGRRALLVLFWLGALLRWRGLFVNRFHADEALYAAWARLIAVWRDPLLQTQPVDKPPLLFYLQALAYRLFPGVTSDGVLELASRLPGFVAALLLIPLVGMLAWRLYGDEATAVLAAALIAMSPLAIQFSATAFLDPPWVAWMFAALLLATGSSRRSLALAGVCLGLAVATKHQAWLVAPLLLGLGWLRGWDWAAWRGFLRGFAPVVALLLLWELARSGSPALFAAQMQNYGGLRPIWSWELPPRLAAWTALGSTLLAAPILLVGLVGLLRRSGRLAHLDALFLLWAAGYALLHWLLAISVWDRYLLPLLPLLALLLARGLAEGGRWITAVLPQLRRCAWTLAALALLLGLQLPGALAARAGGYPVGGRAGADGGAWQIAAYLHDAPYGTVLYDHWASWQWRYHFFDRGVYVSWFPHPAALVDDLRVFAGQGGARYLVLPDAPAAQPVIRALHGAGFELLPTVQTTHLTLYTIVP